MLFFFFAVVASLTVTVRPLEFISYFFFLLLTFPQFSLWLKVFFVVLHSFPGAYVCVFPFFFLRLGFTPVCVRSLDWEEKQKKKRKRVDADLKK